MRRLPIRARITAAVLAFALMTGTGVGQWAIRLPSPYVAAQTALPHLRGINEIRDWFNAGKGHVRLILLLSPT